MPIRVQRSRRRGWKMPANTVAVTRPSRWGNPFVIGAFHNEELIRDAALAVRLFRQALKTNPAFVIEIRTALRGKNLACWCDVGQPCHADVLIEIANS